MTHFTEGEWELFSQNEIDGHKRMVMEDHLMECNLCMNRYLSCITGEKADSAAEILSLDFTAAVMGRISAGNGKKHGRNDRSRFAYYAAAACITIALTGMGVFQQIMDIIPHMTEGKIPGVEKTEFKLDGVVRFGWSDQLMNKTLTLVDAIKPKDGREAGH